MNHLYESYLYYQLRLSSFEEYNTIFFVQVERLKGYHYACQQLFKDFVLLFRLIVFVDLFMPFSREDNNML